MTRLNEFDRQFRESAKDMILEYERKVKDSAAQFERHRERARERDRVIRKILADAKIDVARLDELAAKQRTDSQGYFGRLRQSFIQTKPAPSFINKMNSAKDMGIARENSILIPPYAGFLLVPNERIFADYGDDSAGLYTFYPDKTGELDIMSDSPWMEMKFPYLTTRLQMACTSKEQLADDKPASIFYSFTPPKTTNYIFSVGVGFRGFTYLLSGSGIDKIGDGLAYVELYATMEVTYLGHHFLLPSVLILYRDTYGGGEGSLEPFEKVMYLDFTHSLMAGQKTGIVLTFSLLAVGGSAGGEAEINFKDGTDLFIYPFMINATYA
jgi:hypothetical protein